MDEKARKGVIVLGALILVGLFATVLLTSESISDITSASVAGQTKCVGANAALKFINEFDCERIYESEKCAKRGLVEVQC